MQVRRATAVEAAATVTLIRPVIPAGGRYSLPRDK
jgi:hypothetical protein